MSARTTAPLLLVGASPAREEDPLGRPFTGRAAELLDGLLAEAGLDPRAVHETSVVERRPAGNREPLPAELDAARDGLLRRIEQAAPAVVAAVGTVATRVLRGDAAPLRQVRGRAEVRVLGTRAVHLVALYDPGAALYQPRTAAELRADVLALAELVAQGPPAQPSSGEGPAGPAGADPGQLGLF